MIIICLSPVTLVNVPPGDFSTTAPAAKRRKRSRDRRQASPEPVRGSLGALSGLGPLFVAALECYVVRLGPSIESHEHGEE